MKTRNILAAAVVAALGLGMSAAHADLMIEASGTGISGTVNLNTNTAPNNSGAAQFSGSVGDFNFSSINVTGIGSLAVPMVMENTTFSGNATSACGNSCSLTITLIETGLAVPGSGANWFGVSMGGNNNTMNPVTDAVYLDNSNTGTVSGTPFASATIPANMAPFAYPSSTYVTGITGTNGSFALIEQISLTATGQGQNFSGDTKVSIPEPATLGLMGLALVGAGLARRTRKS